MLHVYCSWMTLTPSVQSGRPHREKWSEELCRNYSVVLMVNYHVLHLLVCIIICTYIMCVNLYILLLTDLSNSLPLKHVLVIGTTNHLDSLDSALRSAGRFEKEISLGIPDEKARKK